MINVLSTTRTLIILVDLIGGTLTNVNVVPGTTGFAYNQPPYLKYGGTWTVVVPLPGIANALGTTAITLTYTGTLAEFSVWSDTALYDESVFYNGIAVANSLTSAGTLVTGPARLLSVSGEAGAGGSLAITLDGTQILAVAAGTTNVLVFPANTILAQGQTLAAFGTFGLAGSVSAYP